MINETVYFAQLAHPQLEQLHPVSQEPKYYQLNIHGRSGGVRHSQAVAQEQAGMMAIEVLRGLVLCVGVLICIECVDIKELWSSHLDRCGLQALYTP